jgi:hypothetical protein
MSLRRIPYSYVYAETAGLRYTRRSEYNGVQGGYASVDEDLSQYLEGMETRLRDHVGAECGKVETRMREHVGAECGKVESRLAGKLERAAQAFAVDIGHVHLEIRAVLDRLKKMDANVTTGVELLVRQSRNESRIFSVRNPLMSLPRESLSRGKGARSLLGKRL